MTNKIEIPDFKKYPELDEFFNKKDKFILDEQNNAIPANLLEWCNFIEQTPENRRRVGRDIIDNYLISTVFLGINHNFLGDELHIFETMVFKPEDSHNNIYCERYSAWHEAEQGHKCAIDWVKRGSH